MREELDEHRDVLNDTGNEIQTNFDFLCDLNRKIDRLQDRIGELFLLVTGAPASQSFAVKPLSSREKEVFVSIMQLTECSPRVSYAQIGSLLGLSPSAIGGYVARLQEKGVHLAKQVYQGQVFVGVDAAFKEAQVKKNVVGVDAPLSRWF